MSFRARCLLVILIVAAVVRIAYWFSYTDHPEFDTPMLDAGWFHDQALAVRAGEWTGDESVFRAPGYVWWLVAVYSVTGPSPGAARLVQLLLGVLAVYLTYRLGARVFGARAGLIAAGLLAVARPVFYFEGELLIASLLPLLTAALLLAVVNARSAPEGRTALRMSGLAGLVAGAFAVARPNVLLFLPAAFAWLFTRARSRALVFASCAAVLIGGVTLRNYERAGEWILIASQAGLNFYLGNHSESDGRHAIFPEFPAWENRDVTRITSEHIGRPAGPGDISRYWAARARDEITADPAAAAKRLLRKAVFLASARPIGNNRDLGLTFDANPVLRLPLVSFALLIPLAVVGVFARARAGSVDAEHAPRAPGASLLLAFIGFYGLSVVLFFVCERFRVPLAVPLAVFAGAGVGEVVARRREIRRLLPMLVTFAAVFLLVRADFFQGDPAVMRGQEAFHRGNVHARRGETNEAIRAYEEAIARIPGVAGPYYHLASLVAGQGRAAEAESLYRRARDLAPNDPEIGNALANHLRDQGRDDEALSVFREVQTAAPGDPWAYIGSGLIRRERGDAGAASDFRRATEVARDLPAAWFERGNTSAAAGNLADAKLSYERVIALDPDAVPPRMNYALVLYRMDDRSGAIAVLRDVLSIEPGNATAAARLQSLLEGITAGTESR